MRKAVKWLESKQRPDGGWGESGDSYWDDKPRGEGPVSTRRRPPGRCSA